MQYLLTEKGKDLFPVMVALRQFGERHLFAPQEEHSVLVERTTGRPVHPEVKTCDGRSIGSDDAVILKVPETWDRS